MSASPVLLFISSYRVLCSILIDSALNYNWDLATEMAKSSLGKDIK